MSKTIVIGDIHNRIREVDSILAKESFDKVIILGDIFDDFDDTPTQAMDSARWVKAHVHDERFTFLWGNHDITYGFLNRNIPCGGYSMEKDCAIWTILNQDDFRPWKFFHFSDGFLFTHAGLHPRFLPPIWKKKDVTQNNLTQFLSQESKRCLDELNNPNGQHWFFLAGDARCLPKRGLGPGGILWCDAREEFEPIPDLAQVFGHTYHPKYPTIIYGKDKGMRLTSEECFGFPIYHESTNILLDCHMACYGILEDGAITLKPVH